MNERAAVTDLIVKLGGPTALANALGATATAASVKKWRKTGQVPWKWRHSLRSIIHQRGLQLTEDENQALALEPERQAS